MWYDRAYDAYLARIILKPALYITIGLFSLALFLSIVYSLWAMAIVSSLLLAGSIIIGTIGGKRWKE